MTTRKARLSARAGRPRPWRSLTLPLLCLGAVLYGTGARADIPFFPEQLNQVSDDTAGYLINRPGSPAGDVTLDVGDRLRGIIRWETIEDLTGGGGKRNLLDPAQLTEFTVVYDVTVSTKVPDPITPGGYVYQFVPTDPGGVMMRFYEDPAKNWTRVSLTGETDDGDPGFTGADLGTGPFLSEETKLGRSQDGAPYWDMGFKGLPGEGWQLLASTDDVRVWRATPPPSPRGTHQVGLNVLAVFSPSAPALGAVNSFFGGTVDFNGSFSVLGVSLVKTPYDFFGNADFVLRPEKRCDGRIGDFVWHDLNRNGIQDPGEPGINGVNVVLKNGVGTTLATTTTGMSPTGQPGYYQFMGLCAGDYQVEAPVALADGKTLTSVGAPGSTPANDSNPTPALVTLPSDNASDQTIDFGYIAPCTGQIGDFLWHDLNRNGIQDAGEPGINGVLVALKDAAGTTIATTTTGLSPTGQGGYYQFTGLCAGDYQVAVPASLADGKTLTVASQGGDPTVDSNPNPALVTLPSDNASDQTIDFGYIAPCTGQIGDFVWHDLNRNGVQEAGEPGINGVLVTLKNAAGATLATTTTAMSPVGMPGYYQFTGLCAGGYQVEVPAVLADGKTLTVANQGGDPTVDSNPSPALVSLPNDNASDQTIDFGYIAPCTGQIGDFVWHDLNRNGIQEPGEPGIDGVLVTLKDAAGATLAATTTAMSPTGDPGYYQFTGLCAGDYQVEVPIALADGKTLTVANQGGDPTVDSNPSPALVSLPNDNASDQTIDFGYIAPCTGQIGDFVWHDLNRNGIQESGEPGINGVLVTLKDAAGATLAATTTAMSPAGMPGYYQFTGLCAGGYQVEVPAMLADGKTPTVSNAPGSTPANDSNPSPALVSLPNDNASDQTIDFGYVAPCTGKIGNFVWKDYDKDGIQDWDEPGIEGVTVNLKDASGSVIATTTTNYKGYYQFTGLCAGSYTVEVPTPAGLTPSPSLRGTDRAKDSNGSPAPVTLPADNWSDQTIDFGFYKVKAPGTGTPGYWVNHPKAWPVDSITIGGYAYTKDKAIYLMSKPVSGDKRYTMFPALVAAKLNVLVGNDSSCIADVIAAADAWMAPLGKLPDGTRVSASSAAWKVGEPLYWQLDAYNNGKLCAPSRDAWSYK